MGRGIMLGMGTRSRRCTHRKSTSKFPCLFEALHMEMSAQHRNAHAHAQALVHIRACARVQIYVRVCVRVRIGPASSCVVIWLSVCICMGVGEHGRDSVHVCGQRGCAWTGW